MNKTRLGIFVGAATVIGVISRLVQLVLMTEPVTGFVKRGYAALSTAVTVFIVALIIGVALAASLVKIKDAKQTGSLIFLVTAVVAAAALVLEPIMLKYYKSLPSSVQYAAILINAVSSITLVLFICSKIFGFSFPKGLLCVLPINQFLRLIMCFMSTSKIITVNDNIYELGFLCASLMFWLYFGQFYADAGNEKTPVKMFVLGSASFVLAMVSAVPKAALLLLGKTELFYTGTTSAFADIILGVLILCAALEVKE